jgi:hypothetical protein
VIADSEPVLPVLAGDFNCDKWNPTIRAMMNEQFVAVAPCKPDGQFAAVNVVFVGRPSRFTPCRMMVVGSWGWARSGRGPDQLTPRCPSPLVLFSWALA